MRETFTSHRLSHLSQLRRNPGSFCPSPFVAPPIPCTLVLNSGFGSLSQVRDRWSLECKSQVWAALLISPRRAVTCFTASRPLSPPHPAPEGGSGLGGLSKNCISISCISLLVLDSGGGKHLHNASINAQPFLQFSRRLSRFHYSGVITLNLSQPTFVRSRMYPLSDTSTYRAYYRLAFAF